MKWFTTVLAVHLLSCFVGGFPHDVPLSNRAEDVVAAAEPAVIEVTVYVDENGKTIGVETQGSHPTATVDNIATGLPPLMAVPDLDAPHELVPTLPTDININANINSHAVDPAQVPQYNRNFGISYSPYNADSSCKNQDQVNWDMDRLTHYEFIRIYGVDCDQTRKVVSAARQRGMKVFAGVYDLQNLQASLKIIIDAVGRDYSILHTISIGNELLNRGQNSAEEVTRAVRDARIYLHSLGYTGPVVTVDTFSQILEHPELCHVSDYCAANCHAFFDATQTPENAGNYVRDIARRLSSVSGGKRTVITESGWPHRGYRNGRAVASPENQRRAIDSLRQTYSENRGDLVLFSAFDDQWKVDNPWTFGAEKFWGIENR